MFWSDGTAGGLAGHRAPEGTAFVIRANNKKAIRAVAKLLAAIMVLPHLLLVGSSSVVMAQTEAATTNVAVLDFANVSKYGDSVISRLATDAVVVELTKSEKFTVETLQRTREAMADLDLRYPLTTAGMLRLAEELAVNAMVVGKVREVSLTDKPRQARVELEVQMLDGATGEPMNGAIVRGSSSPVEDFTGDDDVLIMQAVNNAAYVAVRRMIDYIIPEATVLNAIGSDKVLLNRGAQDGISKGMVMIVTRGDEVIGKIRVLDVTNNDSTAAITSAVRGVKAEDKAKAVFNVPEKVTGGYGEPASKLSGGVIGAPKKKKGIGQVLGVLAGLALVAIIAGQGSSSEDASSGAVMATANGIELTLDPGSFQGTSNLIEYHIYRSDQGLPVFSVPGSSAFALDTVLGTGATPPEIAYQEPDPTNASDLVEKTGSNPGLQVGTQYTYRVRVLYRELTSLTGGSTDSGTDGDSSYRYRLSPLTTMGRATMIKQLLLADLVQPVMDASDVSLSSVTFGWQSALGADQYIVQASLDPSFSTVAFQSGIVTGSPSVGGEFLTLSNQNLSSQFSSTDSATRIYWRVGARRSSDSAPAWSYSPESWFRKSEGPPPPP